ncbi:2954_t:CDS:2 [Racocetra persica]|uniref:2954_t:CDS:1 n=1 Tax=Racocetra persica TaxID=160502 RepID=A0ACA9LYD0_9GLOM|nr:2954_t:CDS:2 [Racocetra persica]
MSSNQLFNDITGEDNISFEYEGISNFENSFDENIISDKNIIDDENDNYYEDSGYTEDEENNTTGSLPITSYFTPQIEPTKKSSNPNEAQLPLTSTTTPTSTPQQTIEAVFQKQMENVLPLSEKQQNRISYHLVAWIVEEMMPLNCINHDRF